MAEYRTLSELRGKTLEYNDTVIFDFGYDCIRYTVKNCFLDCGLNNGYIFEHLNIYKSEFTSDIYGYPSDYGDWPECREGDYEALTRCVRALYKKMGHKNRISQHQGSVLKYNFLRE